MPDDFRGLDHEFSVWTGGGALGGTLAVIYIRLYSGKWERRVPDPSVFEDLEFLYSVDDKFVAFHRNHKKFGTNIIEYGDNHLRNAFCMFDYEMLEPVFNWYENHEFGEFGPFVPTYYALPRDRHFYGTPYQFWEEPESPGNT